ncbi:MAG: rRNA pseudouridine synthase, partial [Candidatus Omnitrophica bacterium]|nr:rRNA pseudouridine synthase [Candidatus Omnitrophota bacterium]
MKQRLNKLIAHSGVCSRRKADELISSGKVCVNGKTVTVLGTVVDINHDSITVNAKPLNAEKKIYILLHKPVGYTTTTKDEHAEKTVLELLPKLSERVYPVGRLDKDTAGLLILTNDGKLSYELTHPKFEIDRVYEATVKNAVNRLTIKKLERSGLEIDDYVTSACRIRIIDRDKTKTTLQVTLREGRKRQIRRMFNLVR